MARRRKGHSPKTAAKGDPRGGGRAAAGRTGAADPVCPLCGRPIPPHARQSLHHLVPRLKGGARGPTVLMHQICHNEIHATLSEAELARAYADIAALRAHPRLARFVAWVADRDPAFHAPSVRPRRRRR